MHKLKFGIVTFYIRFQLALWKHEK